MEQIPLRGYHQSDETHDWKRQHRFTKGKPCLTNLITSCNKASCSVDVGWDMDIIYLDFPKAFDAVFHSLFLKNLMCYALDKFSIWWVGNWLTGHTQRVVTNSFFSNWQSVTSGCWPLLPKLYFTMKMWTRSSLRSLPTYYSITKAASVDDPRFWAGAWQRVATKKWFIRLGIISQQQHNEKRLWVTQYQNYIPYKSLFLCVCVCSY